VSKYLKFSNYLVSATDTPYDNEPSAKLEHSSKLETALSYSKIPQGFKFIKLINISL